MATKVEKEPNILQRFERHFQSRTLDGLMGLVPLIVTIIVVVFVIGKSDDFLRPLLRSVEVMAGTDQDGPLRSVAATVLRVLGYPIVGLILSIIIFYLVGLMASKRWGRRVMDMQSAIMSRIPVVKVIFGVTQQAMTALTSQYNFSRVVFLEWPRDGMVAMGFVTGRAYSHEKSESMVVVYIPTVPNPTSGNMAFVPEDDVIETDLRVEDAMKLVFSGGIVLPEAISLARLGKSDFGLIGQFESDDSV